ncbi:MAG: peptidylprolyl isomerase [Chthoniobacterales bacterium]|nr:peptidylprolyl isomerase [Chthoniobacterales bacterium]
MISAFRATLLSVCACAAGLCGSEVIYRTPASRNIGELLGRGRLLGSVRDRAIYERDLFTEPASMAETMFMAEALRHSGHHSRWADDALSREMNLLRSQFEDETAFNTALEASQLTDASLASLVAGHLEVRAYLEERVASNAHATAEACRQRYQSDSERFQLPARYRARHIFIAAPHGSPPDVIIEKRNFAGALSMRLLAGEDFARLAKEASEDKATKWGGGDLGYFSTWRMPSEFVAELDKLQVGQTSAPISSHLGFHIVQLTELRPGRSLTFEESHAEIATELMNEKRASRVESDIAMIKGGVWSPALGVDN